MSRVTSSFSGDAGYVYFLQDPTQINKIKIGRSLSPSRRIKELYGTSSAARLKLRALWMSQDCKFLETSIQNMFGFNRISGDREFFLVANTEHFSAAERECQELMDEYLGVWIEQVNEAILTTGIDARAVPIEYYYQVVHDSLQQYPESPIGF